MKKILFALFSFAFLSAHAQTVDEVIQKYTASHGGLDAFKKIKTAKLTGNFTAQGNDFPMTIQVINGRAVITDIEVMGNKITNSYKDGKGWKVNPLAGVTSPEDANAAEMVEFKAQTLLTPALMDYKAREHKVELNGQEDVEGKKAYKITLTSKDDGKITTYFINATDYSMIKSITDREFQGQTIAVESWYSEAKDFNGAKFYMARVQKVDGQEMQSIKFDKIELDQPIDEKIFDKP